MKNKYNELKNREIPNIISICEKVLNFNNKQNNENLIIRKTLIKKHKGKILTLEKENTLKTKIFIKKLKKKKKIEKYSEKINLNFKSFFHIFTFLLLNFFFPLSLSYKTRKLYSSSIVNVFIRNPGNTKIISSNFQTSPDTIIINNVLFVDSKTISYKFTTSNNTVQLIWNNPLTNCSDMFSGCKAITGLDFSNFNSPNVVDMNKMFYQCNELEYLNITNLITSSVTNMYMMFFGCKAFTSLDLSTFDTSKVVNMDALFDYCMNIEYLNLGNFNTSSVTTMRSMFMGCTKLVSLNISNFNTSQVTRMSFMFKDCQSLKYLDLSSINTSKVKIMKGMFNGCINLEEINFENFILSSATEIMWMFQGCSKLKSLDLSSFDMTKVKYANNMFSDCEALEYIKFNNSFKMTAAVNISQMFNNCKKLSSLDLSFIYSSKITLMHEMFYNCYNLKIIDMQNLNTISVENINNIFGGCWSLQFLNIYSFVTNNNLTYNIIVEALPNNIIYCLKDYDPTQDIILNMNQKSSINNCSYICNYENKKIINETNTCIDDCNQDKNHFYEFNNRCYDICPFGTKPSINNLCIESIEETTTSIIDDSTIPVSILEEEETSLNITENSIPVTILEEENSLNITEDTLPITILEEEETSLTITEDITPQINEKESITETEILSTQNNNIESSIISNSLSEEIGISSEINKDIISTIYLSQDTTLYNSIITNKGSIFKDNDFKTEINLEEDYTIISGSCKVEEFLSKTCKEHETSIEDKENIINSIKKNIENGNLKELLKNVTNEEKQDITVEYADAKYQLTSSDNQKNKIYNNISTIKLGECENILKAHYNLSKYENLLIFKVDVYEEGLFMPIVEYEIYHPYTLEKLNLEICENKKVQISLPVVINEEDIEKHNPTSNYYNDKCYPSKYEDGVDIILIDRQKEFINNNLTLCENNCKFIKYNIETKQVLCECDIKNEINLISSIVIDKDKLISNFMDLKSLINLDIVKCYKILFTKKGLIKNIGSYILLTIIFHFIISSFIFIGKGYNNLKSQIRDIVLAKEKNINVNKMHLKKDITIKSKLKNMKQNNIKNKSISKSNKKKVEKMKNNAKNKMNKVIAKKNNKKYKNEPPLRNKKAFKSHNKSSNSIIFKAVTNKTQLSQEKSNNKFFYSQKSILVSEKRNAIINNQTIKNFNDYELNSLLYEEALIYDKRTYFQYYLSLLRTKHLLIFSFYPNRDYNSMIIKMCLFFFSFALYLTVNTLFYTDATIHNIYKNSGNFDFNYHIPQILYSTLISTIINMIVKSLSLSEKNILEIKHENNYKKYQRKITSVLKCLKIKFFLFFLISFVFLDLFWYYLACFCAVYSNTQIHLLKDTVLSFCLTLIYPLFINLLPGFFRIRALKKTKHDQQCLYKTSKIIQLI